MGLFGASELMTILILLSLIVLFVWFNVNMSTAMNAISNENRRMSGGLIWLNVVPLLNLIWPFIFNSALKNSYVQEFKKKGIDKEVKLYSGFIYPALPFLALIFSFFSSILFASIGDRAYYSGNNYEQEVLGLGISLGLIYIIIILSAIILQIVFWVNVNNLKTLLLNSTVSNLNSRPNEYQDNQIDDRNYSQDQVNQYNSTTNVIPNNSGSTAQKESSIDKLKKYHEMLNEGLINQHDFDKIKKEILNSNK